jgi:CubicO group peptidase (beta-lactamase class C family)
MKKLFTLLAFFFILSANAQTTYFPPLTGTTWNTLSPDSLGWCQPRIDSLYAYLEAKHSKGFIVLKDGKIVLEKYFGTFTVDSPWYWASAGKSLTATLVGIAQQENLVEINIPVSTYLGSGWTAAPTGKEDSITVKHLLTMTSGLDDNLPSPCENEDTAVACLQYLADAGTRWAYHTGAYRKLQQVVSKVSGVSYNVVTNNRIGNHIGMQGLWINGVYYSKLRGMARFGLLIYNKGIWATDTILHSSNYYYAMTHSSQPFNLSYGYLWWLNGQSSAMAPGLQTVFQQQLFSNAPADMICALGKNDQKIYIVPSQNMVVVRMGDAAYSSVLAFSDFDNELWGYMDSLMCPAVTNIQETVQNGNEIFVYPNPARNIFTVELPDQNFVFEILDATGREIYRNESVSAKLDIDCSGFSKGIYVLQAANGKNFFTQKLIVSE